MSNPSTAPTVPATDNRAASAVPRGNYQGRRFARSFCIFQAVGVVLDGPQYVTNRRTGATASFAVKIGGDRDLDILIAGRDIPELQHRLRGVSKGNVVTLLGSINPPRLHRRETAQFYAEQVVPHTASAQAVLSGPADHTPAGA